jgi:hypothetical protein
MLRFEIYLSGNTFGAVFLGELGQRSAVSGLHLGRKGALAPGHNVLGFRLRLVLRAKDRLRHPENQVAELDALGLTAVGGESVRHGGNLAAIHPPDNVSGEHGFSAFRCPNVSALLSTPVEEYMISLYLYTLDQFPYEIFLVGGLW